MAGATSIAITIAKADASAYILPFLEGFEHADDTDKNGDSLTLHLRNDDGRWFRENYIDKGTEIGAKITSGGMTLDCGLFFLDTISCSNPPAVCVLKATSIPVSGNFKNKKGGDAWEKTTLKDLCALVAKRNGYGLDYKPKDNPPLKRVDQDEESDAYLIRRIANNFGYQVTVKNNVLIVFSEEEYDKQPPTFTFGLNTPMLHVELKTTSQFKVSGVHSAYMNPETGQSTTDDFTPQEPPEGNPGKEEDNDRPDFDPDPDDDFTGN